MAGFNMWARHTKLENMSLERLLARWRKVADTTAAQQLPHLDRFISCGLLSSVLKSHRAAGGDDPGVLTRSDLLANAVPIRARKRKFGDEQTSARMQRAQLAYINAKRQQRILGSYTMSKEERNQEARDLANEFRDMPAWQQN
eukprot:5106650-Karenia_brevis.AAC.1